MKTISRSGSAAAACLIAVLAAASALVADRALAARMRVEHRMEIELIPAAQTLIGSDRMRIRAEGRERLVFYLSERAARVRVEAGGAPLLFERRGGRVVVPLTAAAQAEPIELSISYEARFDDPAPVNPLNTDNPGFGVTATVSEAGTFLLAGAGWYPELEDADAVYHVSVRAPPGILAVTAGLSLGHENREGATISAWQIDHPVRGLALSAAAYEVHAQVFGDVVASAYFLPRNRDLAPAYLAAVGRYLDLYSRTFGPYPFPKFAVVENFFPTGYGFPSYTLIGGSVLRLPFIIDTSLGHEIAHCWWGNGVQVDYRHGNWSEALTTYVADYWYKERSSESEAREQRLQAMRSFAALVPPEKDAPLSRFSSRTDPASKAIGYDKGFMVFHMLRKTVGDEAFWEALRDVQRTHLFRPASWHDFRAAFERRSGRSLKGFFDQWVFRPGTPAIRLEGVRAEPSGEAWRVSGRVRQEATGFELTLDLALETDGGVASRSLALSEASAPFEMTAPATPIRLSLDPDAHVFRRLDPSEIPPSVNSLKGSDSVLVVLGQTPGAQGDILAEILVRSLGLKHHARVPAAELDRHLDAPRDLLLIGHPGRPDLLAHAPRELGLDRHHPAPPADTALFGVFAHPHLPGRIVALFLPPAAGQAETVAAKITHYGRYGLLVFRDGRNLEKKTLPPERSPVVHRWR